MIEQTPSFAPTLTTLETANPGVELRQFVPEDAMALNGLVKANYGHLARFGEHVTRAHGGTEADSAKSIEASREKGVSSFGIYDNGELAGGVDLKPSEMDPGMGVLEYWVDKDHAGRGLASAAARSAVQHAFGEKDMTQVKAFVSAKNPASQHVIKKLGFEPYAQNPEWYKLRKENWPPADPSAS
jgi:ribosomal-protein-alanine N-acetyltransferase